MLPPDDSFQAPATGTKLRGEYELIRFLGAGGMGAVYEAVAPDGRRLAAKLLHVSVANTAGRQFIDRFKREANVTATIDCPNVVSLVDAGVDEKLGLPFMVMPLLVGLDLDELLERIGALHPVLAVRIARQTCTALIAAHDLGVVHRDIKPGNIFLEHAPSGVVTVRVLDFGVAKWRSQDTALTNTGSMLGTPVYMPPEQVTDSKGVDERADLWSLGASLYHMLTDTTPHETALTLGELFLSITTKEPVFVQDRAPWIEPGLAAVVHGTLLRDRTARCPSARALHEALAPFTAGSDEIRATMLQPAPEALLARHAPRGSCPTRWVDVKTTAAAALVTALDDGEHDPLLGRVLGDRYTLLRCLGRGGMGAVYEAEDPDHNRVAVKVLELEAAGANAAMRKRFVREARATASIQNEHVVRLLDAGTDASEERPYIVMELLRGTDLSALIARQGALAPETAARLFTQACKGIAAAHQQGIVHRDIKPANLFLQQLPSGEVAVKICDFGIAKRLASAESEEKTAALTRTGGIIGSPKYMSPEQATNAPSIDLRTDVWSLGISLYEALCGAYPWEGRTTVGELIVTICTVPPVPLQDRAPWVSAGLAEVVQRATTRDPESRWPTMSDFQAALERFTGGTSAVRLTELGPVPEHVRSTVARRSKASTATAFAATTDASIASSATIAQRRPNVAARRRRASAWVVAAGVAVVGAAAVALSGGFRGSADRAPDVPTVTVAAPPPPSASGPVAPASASISSSHAIAPPSDGGVPSVPTQGGPGAAPRPPARKGPIGGAPASAASPGPQATAPPAHTGGPTPVTNW